MSADAKSLEEVLREVAEEIGRFNSDGSSVSLPRYTQYDGLRVIERDDALPEVSEAASGG
jgi:hypothetical protein